LEELGLNHAEALGWESVRLRFNRATVTRRGWIALARKLDREQLESGFLRDDGRITNTLHPAPCCWDGPYAHLSVPGGDAPEDLRLAAPAGDQLLDLMQRAIQIDLGRNGIDVEVLTVPAETLYGAWRSSSPVDALLERVAGAPSLRDPRPFGSAFALPLAQVETVLAWRDGIEGLVVNPTLEGPLWNAQRWFRKPGQI
jgi:hypothetical protein